MAFLGDFEFSNFFVSNLLTGPRMVLDGHEGSKLVITAHLIMTAHNFLITGQFLQGLASFVAKIKIVDRPTYTCET